MYSITCFSDFIVWDFSDKGYRKFTFQSFSFRKRAQRMLRDLISRRQWLVLRRFVIDKPFKQIERRFSKPI